MTLPQRGLTPEYVKKNNIMTVTKNPGKAKILNRKKENTHCNEILSSIVENMVYRNKGF
jgi:hypothetical protein